MAKSKKQIIEVLIDDQYSTMAQKAEALGYADASGLYWRLNNDPTITEDLGKLLLQVAKADTKDIIKKLIKKAKTGDTESIKTFLKYTGQFIDITKIKQDEPFKVDHNLGEGLNEEDVKRIAKSVLGSGGEED